MKPARTIDRPAERLARANSAPTGEPVVGWRQSSFVWALAGMVLWWAACPPLEWSFLALLAPVPWVWVIFQPRLSGKRPWRGLWLASLLFWLGALYWVTLPHWATAFGWLAVSCYLAFYFVGFIAVGRVAVHRLGITPVVAAPVIWTGLEFLRAHFLSGFGMVALAHTQYRWPAMIQISDLAGEYGVSFFIVLVGACLAQLWPFPKRTVGWWSAAALAVAVAATFGYGHWRLGQQSTSPGPKVALVQGSIDINLKYDPKEGQRIFDQYYGLSRQAVDEHPDLDLIVWPETMFREPWFTFDKDYLPPATVSWTKEQIEERSHDAVVATVARLQVPFLLGVDTVHYLPGGKVVNYNTALFTDRHGHILARYDKCHLVPFGEFVPFAETFPWLYRLTPLPNGSRAGTRALAVPAGRARAAVNICYENTLSHFVRDQLTELRDEGQAADILVNQTNDGWFWGSSELDMHLACAVFRSVECRKPYLIAANTGFSAWIDSCGRVVSQGPRRATGVIVATPGIDSRGSWYLDHGDLPAGACLVATLAVAVTGLWRWRRDRRKSADGSV